MKFKFALAVFVFLYVNSFSALAATGHPGSSCAEVVAGTGSGSSQGEQFPLSVIPTLYINGDIVARNQYVRLGGKRYIVRDWYGSVSGDIVILENDNGKQKIKKSSDFKNDRIVIDYVRLWDLLNYKNDRVINRYMRDFKASRAEAEAVFRELMKWFFMLHRYTSEGLYFRNLPGYFVLGVYDEIQRIDDMWHTFILFTIDYTEFGYQQLGYYQHHQPFDAMEPMSEELRRDDRLKMYEFIRKTIGSETLKSWYVDQKYASPELPPADHIPVPENLL